MQYGSLVRASRSRGPDVWLFRWSEQATAGNVFVANESLERLMSILTANKLGALWQT